MSDEIIPEPKKKRLTLTNRWREWAKVDPVWAYIALASMALAFLSLIVHLCFFLPGTIRGFCLITMCVFAGITEFCFIFRKKFWQFTGWWAFFWGLCVILGVILFEIGSYFFGSTI